MHTHEVNLADLLGPRRERLEELVVRLERMSSDLRRDDDRERRSRPELLRDALEVVALERRLRVDLDDDGPEDSATRRREPDAEQAGAPGAVSRRDANRQRHPDRLQVVRGEVVETDRPQDERDEQRRTAD